MATETVIPAQRIFGAPKIPGDKSISHRSLIFGAMAEGVTKIRGLLHSADVFSTMSCLRQLGVHIEQQGDQYVVRGLAGKPFQSQSRGLDCGNSGTTMRLLMGLLSAQPQSFNMFGDASLSKRPMKRVADPLSLMGARFDMTNANYPPLTVHGGSLQGIEYQLPIASAQIKSAILLAALYARGRTTIRGEIDSRDHTERMISFFGGKIQMDKDAISIEGGQLLHSKDIHVPGDPSTAAFWLGAAVILPGSEIKLDHISLNPSRLGFVRVLERMGASIKLVYDITEPEPMGSMGVVGGKLKGVRVEAREVPSLIDEIPLLAVLATQAEGETVIEGAQELRVKESDRIEAVAKNLRAMGAKVEVLPDGFRINGPQKLSGATIETFDDHRIAMAFSIAALVAKSPCQIQHSECVGISYPGFFQTLEELRA